MKGKMKIVILVVVAVAVAVAGFFAGVFIGKKTDASSDAVETTTAANGAVVNATAAMKGEGGVARRICTYKGVDYAATQEGLFAITETDKKRLTAQPLGDYLSIVDDKIYYSVGILTAMNA